MKKSTLVPILLASMLWGSACNKQETSVNLKTVTVTLTAGCDIPVAGTRSIDFAGYPPPAGYRWRYSVQCYDLAMISAPGTGNQPPWVCNNTFQQSYTPRFSLSLIQNRNYLVCVWADMVKTNGNENYRFVENSMEYIDIAADAAYTTGPDREVFCGRKQFNLATLSAGDTDGEGNLHITLSRPQAQINVYASLEEMQYLYTFNDGDDYPAEVIAHYDTSVGWGGIANRYNLLLQDFSNPLGARSFFRATHTFPQNTPPTGSNNEFLLFSDYIFALPGANPSDPGSIPEYLNFTIEIRSKMIADAGGPGIAAQHLLKTIPLQVPLKRNFQVNLRTVSLTKEGTISVNISPGFTSPAIDSNI